MAQRDLTNMQSVVDVVAEKPSQLPYAVADIGKQLMEQNQEARINENMSKVQLELNALDTQYQIDNEKNPTGGLGKYKQARKALFDKYGKDISPLYSRAWSEQTRKIATQNDAQMQGWALKQTRANTVASINSSMKDSLRLANMNGQNFGNSDQTEIGAVLDFANSRAGLQGFAEKNLGATTAKTMLDDYSTDYLKSFISGVAYSNPTKAAQMLQDERVKSKLTSDEMSTIENSIEKQAKRNQYGSLFERMTAEDEVTTLVLSEEGNDYDKRLQIDTMQLQGKISDGAASNARRVLESKKAVNATTSSETMSDLIMQMYDLNVVADTDPESYLEGVNNIRQSISNEQVDGNLSSADAQKLNNQLRTLTGAKTAGATQRVGYEFYDANQMFMQLPPQYRAQATRDLFYKSQEMPNMTVEQQKAEANKIINQTKENIRAKTLKTLDNLKKPTSDFLQTTLNPKTKKPYTMDDVKETALKYGISEEDVIQRMKAK